MSPSVPARSVLLLLLAPLVLAVATACAAPGGASADQSTSPGLAATIATVVADYNERNNRAIQAARASYDASLWAGADTGLVLDGDVFTTRLQQVVGHRQPDSRYDYHLARPLGVGPSGHPTWVALLATTTDTPIATASGGATTSTAPSTTSGPAGSSTAAPSAAGTPSGGEPLSQFVIFDQSDPDGVWLMSVTVAVRADLVPSSAPGAPVSPADLRSATEVGERIRSWLQLDTTPPGLQLGPGVAEARADLADPGGVGKAELACSLLHGTPVATGISDGVRSVRLVDGRLDAVSIVCTKTLTASPGHNLDWNATFAQLFSGDPQHKVISRPYGMQALAWTRDGGASEVLAVGKIPLLAR